MARREVSKNTQTSKHAALIDQAKKITLERKLTLLPITCLQ